MQTSGQSHRRRCGRVPLVHAAVVYVQIGFAHDHRHGLGPRRTQSGHQTVERPRHGDRRVRVAIAGRDEDRLRTFVGRQRLGRIGDEGLLQRRHGHRGRGENTSFPQGDVHGPVPARGLRVLTGAVDGIDDPHAFGGEPSTIVGGFFRQHDVVGASSAQGLDQESVTCDVTFVLHVPVVHTLGVEFLAKFEQHRPGFGGDSSGQLLIGFVGGG